MRCGGVCVVVCEGACGCWGVSGVCGPWGEKVSLAALLFGYLGKSGHLPRCNILSIIADNFGLKP